MSNPVTVPTWTFVTAYYPRITAALAGFMQSGRISIRSAERSHWAVQALQLVAALFFTVALTCGSAEAHGHHHKRHPHHFRHHARTSHQKVFYHQKPSQLGNISSVGGVRFVRGRLICALNVSRWLQAHGFRSPMSPSSKTFLNYAPVARANVHYGDVHFNYRRGGGHVMIALGNGLCLNPSSRRQAWVTKACPTGGTFVRTGA
jgi:hypothetical protein